MIDYITIYIYIDDKLHTFRNEILLPQSRRVCWVLDNSSIDSSNDVSRKWLAIKLNFLLLSSSRLAQSPSRISPIMDARWRLFVIFSKALKVWRNCGVFVVCASKKYNLLNSINPKHIKVDIAIGCGETLNILNLLEYVCNQKFEVAIHNPVVHHYVECVSCENFLRKLFDFQWDFIGKSSGNHSLDSQESRESHDLHDNLWTSFHVVNADALLGYHPTKC